MFVPSLSADFDPIEPSAIVVESRVFERGDTEFERLVTAFPSTAAA